MSNSDSNTVSVIDTATNKVTPTVPVRSDPFGVAVSPDIVLELLEVKRKRGIIRAYFFRSIIAKLLTICIINRRYSIPLKIWRFRYSSCCNSKEI